ncbi:MAG: aspartate kinase, partial [Leucobacter sp.]|nr:aspartate kinase [Leucobacter sp.]
IYTDVDGVFTTAPRVVPLARKIDAITAEEMLELAASGAKVLHLRAVEYARRHGVVLHVRSSFTGNEGTIVYDPIQGHPKGEMVEEPIITGIAFEKSEAKVTVGGVPDVPGTAAQIFELVAKTNANIDMIVQNVSAENVTDISFTVPMASGPAVMAALEAAADEIGYTRLQYDDQIAKIAVVGAGMRDATGVSAQLFRALFDAGINIEMISTSEIRVSVVTHVDAMENAVKALHTAFGLDANDEATVYAGTGR